MERGRSAVRVAAVWDALDPILAAAADDIPPRPLRVLDLGGGTGGAAVRLAERGHAVTVVDPSPDALASLERRAAEAGVDVAAVLGDADTLLDVAGAGSADLVLCHGVLEVVDDPAGALRQVARALVPRGRLSLLAAQKSAAVLGRALAGHLAEARALLADPDAVVRHADAPSRRFTRAGLEDLLDGAGFALDEVRGVRVFVDHVDSAVVDADPAAAADLLALESAVAELPDYLAMATQLHLLATAR